MMMLAINSSGYLVYNFAYLTLYPKFECYNSDG